MKMVLGCQENGAVEIMRLANYIRSVIFASLIRPENSFILLI